MLYFNSTNGLVGVYIVIEIFGKILFFDMTV